MPLPCPHLHTCVIESNSAAAHSPCDTCIIITPATSNLYHHTCIIFTFALLYPVLPPGITTPAPASPHLTTPVSSHLIITGGMHQTCINTSVSSLHLHHHTHLIIAASSSLYHHTWIIFHTCILLLIALSQMHHHSHFIRSAPTHPHHTLRSLYLCHYHTCNITSSLPYLCCHQTCNITPASHLYYHHLSSSLFSYMSSSLFLHHNYTITPVLSPYLFHYHIYIIIASASPHLYHLHAWIQQLYHHIYITTPGP